MNKLNIKSIVLTLFALTLIVTSCKDDVDVDIDNGNKYETSSIIEASIVSQNGLRTIGSTSFRDSSIYNLFVETNKPVVSDVSGKITLSSDILTEYNKNNSTTYPLLSSEVYSLSSGGSFILVNGSKKSGAIAITFNPATKIDPTITYAIPLDIEFTTASDKLSKNKGSYILLVRGYSAYPAPGNKNGIKLISCMEINDVNPLNNLSYTLKSTGQPLFDMVILFSSNVNYSDQLARPYISHNTQMTNILANTEKYIKPLKDRGIKVILSLLGNWDRAGVANMSAETAALYAQEIKNTLDIYGLDGVMFDDEYSAYQNPVPPGFVPPSSDAAGRLMYETKKVIGDKLVFSYVYSRLEGFMPTIDGVQPGKYVDYALSDYFREPVSDLFYPGMTNKQKAPWSQEFARGYFLSLYGSEFGMSYEEIVSDGYGAHMVFSLNPKANNFARRQLPELQKMTQIICEDELVYDKIVYEADYR